ncbi:putative protein AFG1 [Glarea lozoyensis 74030]|uniref:Lactation elevated protein 1 n=1 Tax=Glarea lozoyensis (strain ATCC 74030 / MF5533) TaxID=1104152 RepID=H0EDM9_GLAL7|nr:putative protein AFG1 [Glarea lozoyensis 74030]
MQDVHKRLHKMKLEHGNDIDAIPFIAADIAQQGNVLCFDEFQCTDVADAMILRRLLEALMSHGVVLVTTSNRHPDDLYRNGIQLYESRAKLVLTSAVPLTQLFLSRQEIEDSMKKDSEDKKGQAEGEDLDDAMRLMMDDLGMNMTMLKNSSIFSGDEERFAFARALSRLSEMGSQEWVERGMGLENKGGKAEKDNWQKVRSKQLEDSM